MAVVVGAVLVEVAGGAAAFEGTAVGKGVELGVALGALKDYVAIARDHFQSARV